VIGTRDLAGRSRTEGTLPPIQVANSAEEFGEVILRLLDNPAEAREWGERGRSFAERYASRERVLERIAELYSLVLAKK
jgi:glycosyltransferase involved in cell wall biosynthesis